MWEPSVLTDVEQQLKEVLRNRDQLIAARLSGKVDSKSIETALKLAEGIESTIQKRIFAIQRHISYVISDDEVTFVNSLQVMYASRFVMSKNNDFSLAIRMIGDNEKYRTGIRPKVG